MKVGWITILSTLSRPPHHKDVASVRQNNIALMKDAQAGSLVCRETLHALTPYKSFFHG